MTRLPLLTPVAVLLVMVSACGGGEEHDPTPGLGDTASVVPERASGYAEVTLEPDDLQENRLNVLDAHFHVSAIDQIERALLRWGQAATGLDRGLDFTGDIAPWMASRVGLFSVETVGRLDFAVVLPIDDLPAFDAFRGEAMPDDVAERLAVDDENLKLEPSTSVARVGDFVVFGDPQAVQASAGAYDGRSLLDTGTIQALVERPATARALAFGIVDTGLLVSVPVLPSSPGVLAYGPSAGISPPALVTNDQGGKEAANRSRTSISSFLLTARREGITLDVQSNDGRPLDLGAARRLFATLPGSAWIAYVHPEFRRTVGGLFRRSLVRGLLRRQPEGTTPASALRDFERLVGVDVTATTQGIETGGFFLGNVSEFAAGAVIEFSSSAGAREAAVLARLAFAGLKAPIAEIHNPRARGFVASLDGGEVFVSTDRDRLVFASDLEALQTALSRRTDSGGAKDYPELGSGYEPIGYADLVQLATGIGIVDVVITPSFDRTIASVVDVFERLAIGVKTADGGVELRLVAAP